MLVDARLYELIQRIASISHVSRLRIHTRLPIVLPDRVTETLLDMLLNSRITPWLVVHANHPREIADDCAHALRQLVTGGITTLNQTVLLRGVNDDVAVLQALSEKLFSLNVLPYYLHLLDPVPGVGHFDVPQSEARELMTALRARLPGYLVPQLVREIAGASAKLPIV